MPLSVDPSDPLPIYVQIMDEIRRGIVVGAWRPGEPLPSASDLAVELRVNPNTVQKAYRELERRGVVEARRGSGTFVRQGAGPRERRRLAEDLAERCARQASRSGISVEELIAALKRHADVRGEELDSDGRATIPEAG